MGQLNDEIDAIAAAWAAKVAGGILTSDEQERFDSWRAADVRHLGAFARAQAVLLRLERLRAVGAEAVRASIDDLAPATADGEAADLSRLIETDATRADVIALSPKSRLRRRLLVGGAAASLAAALLAGVVISTDYQNQTFATGLGETRELHLPDGSLVTLNTNSKLTVAYSEKFRRLQLLQGEAIFKVAKNKHRPFIVAAHDTEVRAVGTSFTVRVLPARPVQILVQEGVVEVMRHDKPAAKPIRAVAETQAIVPTSAPIMVQAIPHPAVARELAWQYGRIALENETLAEAAEEFARYSDTRIVVDPAVADRTITGLFASNDPVRFAEIAASVLELHVEKGPKEVRIVR